MIIFGMIADLDHAFCNPYIFCTRSQTVAALVSQIQITVRRASLSMHAGRHMWDRGERELFSVHTNPIIDVQVTSVLRTKCL